MTKRDRWVCGFAAALVVTTSACRDRRVHECTELVERINSADAAVSKGGATGDRSRQMAGLAQTIARERSTIVSLALDDTELQRLRNEYVTMLEAIERASKALADSPHRGDATAQHSAIGEIEAASAKEAAVVNQVNAYCQTTSR